MAALLELSGVKKAFASTPPVKPLDGIDLVVPAGRVVCVTGVSGKGKSTLLNVAGGLLAPDEGSVRFDGEDIAKMSSDRLDAVHACGIGFVLQVPYMFQALTARENLAFVRRLHPQAELACGVDDILEEFGLVDRENHLPHELSVGQRRRLAVARALMVRHKVLLCDEPTNDLDGQWSDYVFSRFEEFTSRGGAVVVVTHDREYARRADTIYALEDGKLVEEVL